MGVRFQVTSPNKQIMTATVEMEEIPHEMEEIPQSRDQLSAMFFLCLCQYLQDLGFDPEELAREAVKCLKIGKQNKNN